METEDEEGEEEADDCVVVLVPPPGKEAAVNIGLIISCNSTDRSKTTADNELPFEFTMKNTSKNVFILMLTLLEIFTYMLLKLKVESVNII